MNYSRALSRAIALWLMCATSIAMAGRKVLVLKADGNASVEIKVRVDAQVLRLAKTLEATVESGEITFADASTAVGCSGTETQCRNDVLSTMAVDEVVSLTVTGLPNGDIRVAVHRIGKTGPIRDAEALIPAGQSIDTKVSASVGPLFGVKSRPTTEVNAAPALEPDRGTASRPEPAGSGAANGTGRTDDVFNAPFEHAPSPLPPPRPQPQPQPQSQPQPSEREPEQRRSSGRAIAGMAIGGGLMTLAIVLWTQASGVQIDINGAATSSPADFKRLQDLESKGDAYANFGNAFFIAGAVVAGVSSYFFFRNRLAPSRRASVAPAVFDHGAGIALTIVGTP